MKLILITLVALVVGLMVGCSEERWQEITLDETVDLVEQKISLGFYQDKNCLFAMLPHSSPMSAKETQPIDDGKGYTGQI